ncbi:hypothetical protein [Holdemanella sp.]|uniref:hypothetical protein n=1 Tax=Holdemanella sp. TaxID=1971762 RepID=UPI0025880653|nr:hypothetical protein [Holdemanella sp.]
MFSNGYTCQEVDLSFEYTGEKIEIENAEMYFTQSWNLLDEAPTDCGSYIAWTSDEDLFTLKSILTKYL